MVLAWHRDTFSEKPVHVLSPMLRLAQTALCLTNPHSCPAYRCAAAARVSGAAWLAKERPFARDCASGGTTKDLHQRREIARDAGSEAFVFPSENLESPLDMSNVWRRMFRPRLEKVGLRWATFQVLRRTNATVSHMAGVDAKVSADQRGHVESPAKARRGEQTRVSGDSKTSATAVRVRGSGALTE